MSLESIVEHILNEARLKKEDILLEARKEAERIIREARKEAERISQEILDKEKLVYQNQKQGLLVSARLEAKKDLLRAKQELITAAFEKLKSQRGAEKLRKQQVYADKIQETAEDTDYYLNKIRPDYEAEIARILFT